MKFLTTNLPYPPEILCGSCGLKQAGKSLFAREQGFAIVKEEGGEILWLETEEPNDFMFEVEVEKDNELGLDAHPAWNKAFAKKYGVEAVINFQYLPDTVSMMSYFGINGKVIIEEAPEVKVKELKPKKGESEEAFKERQAEADKKAEEKQKGAKLEFKMIKVDTDNSSFAKMLKEHDIRYIVVDSITVFNTLIIGGRQNFSNRSQVEGMFFETLKALVHKRCQETKKPIYIFTTNHLAHNPTDPFTFKMDEKFLIEKGGSIIGHEHKVYFGFKKFLRPHGGREIVVMRYPNIPEFSIVIPRLITDEGFKVVTRRELEEASEEQKAEAKEAKAG
jgi:hypothetical protein